MVGRATGGIGAGWFMCALCAILNFAGSIFSLFTFFQDLSFTFKKTTATVQDAHEESTPCSEHDKRGNCLYDPHRCNTHWTIPETVSKLWDMSCDRCKCAHSPSDKVTVYAWIKSGQIDHLTFESPSSVQSAALMGSLCTLVLGLVFAGTTACIIKVCRPFPFNHLARARESSESSDE